MSELCVSDHSGNRDLLTPAETVIVRAEKSRGPPPEKNGNGMTESTRPKRAPKAGGKKPESKSPSAERWRNSATQKQQKKEPVNPTTGSFESVDDPAEGTEAMRQKICLRASADCKSAPSRLMASSALPTA